MSKTVLGRLGLPLLAASLAWGGPADAAAKGSARSFDYDAYVRDFNQGDDGALIERYFAEDIVFMGSTTVRRGRDELKAFLDWAHNGIREVIRPQAVLRSDTHLFAEIDMDFIASKLREDFTFGAMRPGDILTVKFFVLYTIEDGKITELKSMTWKPEAHVTKAPRLGPSAGQRAAFLAYTQAFSAAEYERFAAYYTEDVVLELPSAPPITGRQGIVDFYSMMFPKVRETLFVNQLAIDRDAIAGDFTSLFTAIEDAPDFSVGPLKKGEAYKVRVIVYYTLRDGLISHIKVVRGGNVEKLPPEPSQ